MNINYVKVLRIVHVGIDLKVKETSCLLENHILNIWHGQS